MPPKEKTKLPIMYNIKNTTGATLSIPKTSKTEPVMKQISARQLVQEQPKKVVVPRGTGIEKRRAISEPPSYKKGGLVAKTGMALVHKGEVVVPAARVASVDKALKKAGMKPLKK